MTKKRTNITLDPQIYEKAKKEGINVSRLTEKALRRYIRRLEGRADQDEKLFGEIMGSEADNLEIMEEPDQTPEEFLEDFRQSCAVDWNLAERTTEERVRYARKLVEYLDGHPLEATKDQLRAFIDSYEDDNAVKSVRVIYGRFFDKEIAKSFKIPESSPSPKQVPDKEGLRKIYDQLEELPFKVAYLLLATSGLRRGELMKLTPKQLEPATRTIYPPGKKDKRQTKRQWVTFYNHEAERELKKFGIKDKRTEEKIFQFHPATLTRHLARASKRAETVKTTPQILRIWFADQLNRLGVADRYIDALCGRAPKSVLAKHYTDFSPRRLREVYEEAGLEVLN